MDQPPANTSSTSRRPPARRQHLAFVQPPPPPCFTHRTGYFVRPPNSWSREGYHEYTHPLNPPSNSTAKRTNNKFNQVLRRMSSCSTCSSYHEIVGTLLGAKVIPNSVRPPTRKRQRQGSLDDDNAGSVTTEDDHADDLQTTPFEDSQRSQHFRRYFFGLTDQDKLQLHTGRFIEDRLLHAEAQSKTYPPVDRELILNWVVDLQENSSVRGNFNITEWNEMVNMIPKFEKSDLPSDEFVEFISRFKDINATQEFRAVLESTHWTVRPPNAEYDQSKHADLEWGFTVLKTFLDLYSNPNLPLQSPHLESWWLANVWNVLIDRLFGWIKGVQVDRTEVTCVSSAARRNHGRQDAGVRQRIGPRLDGMVRTVGNYSHELLAIEVGRDAALSSAATSRTKWLRDARKLRKVLCDMIAHQQPPLPEVYGFAISGLTLQVLRLVRVGNISLLKTENVVSIPADVSGGLSRLTRVMSTLILVRNALIKCKESIGESPDADSGMLGDELFSRLGGVTQGCRERPPVDSHSSG